jgi:hypothetical protein
LAVNALEEGVGLERWIEEDHFFFFFFWRRVLEGEEGRGGEKTDVIEGSC